MARTRSVTIGLQVALLAVAFGLGVGARQALFEFEPRPDAPAVAGPVTLRVSDAAAASATRTAILRYLFGRPALPVDRPERNADGSYLVKLQHSLTSTVQLLRPSNSNGRLTLYHAGHTAYGEVERPMVDALLAAGDTVLVFDMPLIGVNEQVVSILGPNGLYEISRHDHLAYLDEMTEGSPIRFFVEPVVVMLNELAADYDEVAMVGLSGGGWTTTLSAAIDPRIERSYPVAGTSPMAVRFARPDSWGDWEQSDPGLYELAGYEDLYVLGAQNRRQLQVVNEFDPCCFGGDYRSIYLVQVQVALRELGGGTFDVFVDTENGAHSIGRAAIARILADLDGPP